AVSVPVGVAVPASVAVGVLVGVSVAVAVSVGVAVAVSVTVGVVVLVAVALSVLVGAGVAVGASVAVLVAVVVGVTVGASVAVAGTPAARVGWLKWVVVKQRVPGWLSVAGTRLVRTSPLELSWPVFGSTEYGCSPAWSRPWTSAQAKLAQISTGRARSWTGAPPGSVATTLNERTAVPPPTWRLVAAPDICTVTTPVGESTK